MSIDKLIINTLKPIGIPVNFQTYKGSENTYITFFEYLQQGEQFSDDTEEITGHYIQIDVWSKRNYNKIVRKTKRLLKTKGFIRKFETELYESDTKIYHKIIRFFFIEENEEDE